VTSNKGSAEKPGKLAPVFRDEVMPEPATPRPGTSDLPAQPNIIIGGTTTTLPLTERLKQKRPPRESGPRGFQRCEDFGAVFFGWRKVRATVFAFFTVNRPGLSAVRARLSRRPFLDAQERQESGEAAEQMEYCPTQSRPDVKVVAPGQP
jgi:hypothetical protein